MLGVGDFYYELGVQIIEVCLATSHRNGGMIYLCLGGKNLQGLDTPDILRKREVS